MRGSLVRMGRVLAVLALSALAAAPAAAKDGGSSLLSGYGGPGDGEQAMLGQQLYAPSRSGSRGANARSTPSAAPRAPSPTAIYATPAPAASPATPAAPSARAHSSRPKAKAKHRRSGSHRKATKPAAFPQRAAVVPAGSGAAPAVVVRPTSAPAPLRGAALALAALLLAALLALGLTARRLAVLSAQQRRNAAPRGWTAYAGRPGQAP